VFNEINPNAGFIENSEVLSFLASDIFSKSFTLLNPRAFNAVDAVLISRKTLNGAPVVGGANTVGYKLLFVSLGKEPDNTFGVTKDELEMLPGSSPKSVKATMFLVSLVEEVVLVTHASTRVMLMPEITIGSLESATLY
jgi:hypothetical protein